MYTLGGLVASRRGPRVGQVDVELPNQDRSPIGVVGVVDSTTTISGRPEPDTLAVQHREQRHGRAGTTVSPTDPSGNPRVGGRGTSLRLGRRDAASKPDHGLRIQRYRPTSHPGVLIGPRVHRRPAVAAPTAPTRRASALQAPCFVAHRAGELVGVELLANRTNRSPSASISWSADRGRDAAQRPGQHIDDAHPTPDRHPTTSPTPGTAAAVSARCNNRSPSRSEVLRGFGQRLLRERRQPSEQPGERDLTTLDPRLQPAQISHTQPSTQPNRYNQHRTAATRPTRLCTSAVLISPALPEGVTRLPGRDAQNDLPDVLFRQK